MIKGAQYYITSSRSGSSSSSSSSSSNSSRVVGGCEKDGGERGGEGVIRDGGVMGTGEACEGCKCILQERRKQKDRYWTSQIDRS